MNVLFEFRFSSFIELTMRNGFPEDEADLLEKIKTKVNCWLLDSIASSQDQFLNW
jgi:hypothetical protein